MRTASCECLPCAEAENSKSESTPPPTQTVGAQKARQPTRDNGVGFGMTILVGWSIPRSFRWCGSSGSAAGLRCAQVALGRVLREIENHDLIRSARAVNVKLNRFANGAVLLLDGFVVRDDVHRVFVVLVVHFFQRDLNR